MKIFTYWEGPRPDHIEVCLNSMSRVLGDSFHLVTPNNLYGYIGRDDLHPTWKNLNQIALRVDCIRAALLAQYGGWWFDADTICFQSPSNLMSGYPNSRVIYMTWTRPPVRVLNGYIYMDMEIASIWLAVINQKLEHEFTKIDWCSIGEGVLTSMLSHQTRAEGIIQIERRLFLPIDIDSDVKDFFRLGDPLEYIKDDTICFGMNHSYFMYHHGKIMAKDQWNSPLLIHRLLRDVA